MKSVPGSARQVASEQMGSLGTGLPSEAPRLEAVSWLEFADSLGLRNSPKPSGLREGAKEGVRRLTL